MKSIQNLGPVLLVMIIGAFARLIPHAPNITPIESMAIFSGAYLSRKYWGAIIPIVTLYFSDFIINNTVARSFFPEQEGIVWYDHYMLFNVIAIFCMVGLSAVMLKKINFINVLVTVLGASVIFFIITNFGSWASPKSIYTNDVSGLLASYTAALPFFRASLIGNLVFTTIFFGSFEIAKNLLAQKSPAQI